MPESAKTGTILLENAYNSNRSMCDSRFIAHLLLPPTRCIMSNVVDFDDDITDVDIVNELDDEADTVIKLIPFDYKRCEVCNHDHKYEWGEAIVIHKALISDELNNG